jgi:alpha-N-acetylglucosamine transferase
MKIQTGRRDLAHSLTKLHLFRLTQYSKVIFLDADTLVLRPLSHLFDLPVDFAAAPDQGWPDAFNSGVMVATPSIETFDALTAMMKQRGSWDGGDQGLLNDFFPNWHRLSFTYNVTPSAYYTCVPSLFLSASTLY